MWKTKLRREVHFSDGTSWHPGQEVVVVDFHRTVMDGFVVKNITEVTDGNRSQLVSFEFIESCWPVFTHQFKLYSFPPTNENLKVLRETAKKLFKIKSGASSFIFRGSLATIKSDELTTSIIKAEFEKAEIEFTLEEIHDER